MAAILVLVTMAHAAWTFRKPLLDQPWLSDRLRAAGILETPGEPVFRDLDNIRLVSRDLQAHPGRAGILVLSATFVNRSARSQPWPLLELTLLDASNMPVARRRFEPLEYLGGEPADPHQLSPGLHVPVEIEFADPGVAATGFELAFH